MGSAKRRTGLCDGPPQSRQWRSPVLASFNHSQRLNIGIRHRDIDSVPGKPIKAPDHAFGNVTPTCPWYLPPLSL